MDTEKKEMGKRELTKDGDLLEVIMGELEATRRPTLSLHSKSWWFCGYQLFNRKYCASVQVLRSLGAFYILFPLHSFNIWLSINLTSSNKYIYSTLFIFTFPIH